MSTTDRAAVQLTLGQARRIAVRAQLLDLPRPHDLLEVVRRLAAVQVDLTSYVAPNADLVLWSRLRDAYSSEELVVALEAREVVEIHGFLREADDIALYRAEMDAWPGQHADPWQVSCARWVEANEHARDEILQALRSDGPLTAKDLPDDGFVKPWRSSGWNSGKNVQMMLERLEESGQVAVSHREGRERVWDLADRVYPEVDPLPVDEALRVRAERRLASLGLARQVATKTPNEPNYVGAVGVEAVVEGVRGRWRVDEAALECVGMFRGRVAVISPLDRLIFDRKRMDELFDFDYTLEMYKPAASRRWGYFALPVLSGDRFIGKVDAEADRKGGFLRVHAIHRDEPWPASVSHEVTRELESLARMVGLRIEFEG